MPAPVSIDAYLGPHAVREPFAPLCAVRLADDRVMVHAAWRATPLDAAIDADGTLRLQRVTPAMMVELGEVRRTVLLHMLAGVRKRISWRDNRGRCFRRRPLFGLPIGRHFRVNGATALTMLMSAAADRNALRLVLRSGLPFSIGEFQGSGGAQPFTADDVADVLAWGFARIRRGEAPQESNVQLRAMATLVSHYVEGYSKADPAEISRGMLALLSAIAKHMPHNSANLGLTLGTVLAGAFLYSGKIAFEDFRRRWQVASLVNTIWAGQSFVPLFNVAGPVAVIAVGAGIAWDYNHPPRDYNDVVRHFEGEFLELCLLTRTPTQVAEISLWTRRALLANAF